VFERFTERARQVVVLAQDEARALKHNYIGTEHILLGLLREEEGLAARVLESLDITVEEVRAQVARIVGQGDEVTTGQIPFTPRAKKVLELALREALSLGHNYIGTEHILLGLVRENEGVASRILLDFDADDVAVRKATIDMLPEGAPPDMREDLAEREAMAAAANPELAAQLERVRQEKERALDVGEFERAARARHEERVLQRRLLGLPEPSSKPAVSWSTGGGFRAQRGFRRIPHRVATHPPARPPGAAVGLLLTGAVILAVGLAFGIAIGWLIWS
jgi:ATP-dependent Clp protease ATP-binding subunit ClpA